MIEILYFGAEWCAPCKTLAPIMKTIADTNLDVSVLKIDIEDEFELGISYQVRSVPTLLYLRDGIELARTVGINTESEVQSTIDYCKSIIILK